jgi:hypothetical protein
MWQAACSPVSEGGGREVPETTDREEPVMHRTRWAAVGILVGLALTGCEEKGPGQRVGERIDRAMDELTGKGPAEKAGEQLDRVVGELARKR